MTGAGACGESRVAGGGWCGHMAHGERGAHSPEPGPTAPHSPTQALAHAYTPALRSRAQRWVAQAAVVGRWETQRSRAVLTRGVGSQAPARIEASALVPPPLSPVWTRRARVQHQAEKCALSQNRDGALTTAAVVRLLCPQQLPRDGSVLRWRRSRRRRQTGVEAGGRQLLRLRSHMPHHARAW